MWRGIKIRKSLKTVELKINIEVYDYLPVTTTENSIVEKSMLHAANVPNFKSCTALFVYCYILH